jgi:hypothetical protein
MLYVSVSNSLQIGGNSSIAISNLKRESKIIPVAEGLWIRNAELVGSPREKAMTGRGMVDGLSSFQTYML